MTDPTTDFFEGINHRGPNELLRTVRGTVRFELEEAGEIDHWLLVLSEGSVSATHADRPADCTVTTDRDYFHQLVTGRASQFAGLLRNRISVEGNLILYYRLNHLLPGPPGAHDPRDWVRKRGQRR